jgi:2-dehydro-3-deoxyphosphooctonate aldolase (KDO 8-P synthase)
MSVSTKLDIYAGPCVLESEDLAKKCAQHLLEALDPYRSKLNFYFKGSFDKANRSSISSYRGPGIEKGLRILSQIKSEFGVKVITDFHLPSQADEVASVVDVLQVPAFLCRQTDMIIAGAKACKKYARDLKIKKGQFLSPSDCKNIVEKANEILPKSNIVLTERGTSFGYNNLIVDMGSFEIMKSFGVRAIFDVTHSAQMPGGLGKATGGKREQIISLAGASLVAGASGLFFEAHPDPQNALSDATTQLSLTTEVPTLLKQSFALFDTIQRF